MLSKVVRNMYWIDRVMIFANVTSDRYDNILY